MCVYIFFKHFFVCLFESIEFGFNDESSELYSSFVSNWDAQQSMWIQFDLDIRKPQFI